MQPYFFPYIGYFQLINAVDEFVIYDNIQFTKKGWINRNRILVNGKAAVISLPIKNGSDFLNISDRFLSETWPADRKKLLNRIKESYRKAPFFEETYFTIEKCIMYENRNLFNYIFNSLQILLKYLNISTKIVISSSLVIDDELKNKEKVKAICLQRGADVYINPIGGLELYDKEDFRKSNIELKFHKTNEISYSQFTNEFVPHLSIIDVLMFNDINSVKSKLESYNLY